MLVLGENHTREASTTCGEKPEHQVLREAQHSGNTCVWCYRQAKTKPTSNTVHNVWSLVAAWLKGFVFPPQAARS